MKRRVFIKYAGTTVSVPFFFRGMGMSALSRPLWFEEESDRILVLVKLSGGNDGLNMFLPFDQYDRLYNARPNIILPEDSALNVTDTLGFHPAMGALRDLYEDARLGIVQSVGYPNQNRSHFKSIEIWNTGRVAGNASVTGWLGRYLDEQHPGFPEGYPSGQHPDPFAISMGSLVSETCQGVASNFSLTLNDPFSLGQLAESDWDDPFEGTIYGDELTFLRQTIAGSNSYFSRIEEAVNLGSSLANYPDTRLGEQLQNVARMISGGLQTRIFVVTLGGFDTHARQVEFTGPTTVGIHANLLQTLSEAVYAFQDDLRQQGLEERVLGMTFSEFGRQIRSNASYGTDHGAAAPLVVFGSCVNPQILGSNPEIPEEVTPQEAVAMQYDFRDVYGSVLMDWFGVAEENVQTLLHEDFQYLPIVNGCNVTTSTEGRSGERALPEAFSYPNPFTEWTTIGFTLAQRQRVRLSIFDGTGREIETVMDRELGAGTHQVRYDGRRLSGGNYYFRLVGPDWQETRGMVKHES